jgi:hypothetical protein
MRSRLELVAMVTVPTFGSGEKLLVLGKAGIRG